MLRHDGEEPILFISVIARGILCNQLAGCCPTRMKAPLFVRPLTAPEQAALRAFAAEGLACLRPKPKTPKTILAAWPNPFPAIVRGGFATFFQQRL